MTVNIKEIAMDFHHPRLCWRRGDAIFHGLDFEVSSLHASCGKTRGYPRVCLIHSGSSGCVAKKDRVCLSVATQSTCNWRDPAAASMDWGADRECLLVSLRIETLLWQMRVNAVTHINRLLVERDIWTGVDDLPEGVGKYPPAKPAQINDVTIHKLYA